MRQGKDPSRLSPPRSDAEGVRARVSEKKPACISEAWDRVIIAGDTDASIVASVSRTGDPGMMIRRCRRRFSKEPVPRAAGSAVAGLSLEQAVIASMSDMSLGVAPRGLDDGQRVFLFDLAIGDFGGLLAHGRAC